jgi:uncharacterized membrane protein
MLTFLMARLIWRTILAALFLFAGVCHLLNPQLFRPIMPPWIPAPIACIIVSGIAELAGGIGLLIPVREIQRAAGWGLLLLLVAVFPANIYMAAAHIQVHGFPPHNWISWARLPLQPLLMLAVSWAVAIWPRARENEKAPAAVAA